MAKKALEIDSEIAQQKKVHELGLASTDLLEKALRRTRSGTKATNELEDSGRKFKSAVSAKADADDVGDVIDCGWKSDVSTLREVESTMLSRGYCCLSTSGSVLSSELEKSKRRLNRAARLLEGGASVSASGDDITDAMEEVEVKEKDPVEWIFVLSLQDVMLVHPKIRGLFHHSSFLGVQAYNF
jgi:hypothetical protein